VIVAFDGTARLDASAPIRPGGQILLDLALDRVASQVAVPNQLVAVEAHLLARFDGGVFAEVTGLPASTAPAKGATIDTELPLADGAVLFDVPSSARQFEMFYRVERWSFHGGFFEDGDFQGTLVAPASDGFVSNFGANYRLAVLTPTES
jgi:hypothetical protein